jgi:hypothetical protein
VPSFVTDPFSSTALDDFDYCHLEGGKVLVGKQFSAHTARIKREAKAKFGVDFDKP